MHLMETKVDSQKAKILSRQSKINQKNMFYTQIYHTDCKSKFTKYLKSALKSRYESKLKDFTSLTIFITTTYWCVNQKSLPKKNNDNNNASTCIPKNTWNASVSTYASWKDWKCKSVASLRSMRRQRWENECNTWKTF